jgi:hypothetical protein
MMGVRKFRSVEEMPGPSPLPRLDPENLRIAFGLASLASGLRPLRLIPGVRKFRSWDEALAAKAADESASSRPPSSGTRSR